MILEFDSTKNVHGVKQIQPALTADFPSLAERPLFSALDCTSFLKTFGLQLPDWKMALELAMQK
jgi:dTDP-4-dehydrorhamnose reductase